MTSLPNPPGAAPPASRSAEPTDTEAPDVVIEEQSRNIREQLEARVNSATHPSRLVNQICLADMRCSESVNALLRLTGRSPKILQVVRAELRNAFDIDPDSLLFTEPKPPLQPEKVNTLTDRALALLVQPHVSINVNQFTALSIKGDPGRRLPFTPLVALERVIALRLFERLAQAASQYWDSLAQGSWLSRRERWVELHKHLFAERAFIARQLEELSSAGMAMVQAVIDAPTSEARQRAGGERASVRVAALMWPGTPSIAIPGAVHIYRENDPADVPHIVYLPGVTRNFYEYPSFAVAQCGLLELNRSLFHNLWHCLPLNRRNKLCRPEDLSPASSVVRGLEVMGDALALGAQALLSEQWGNELACAVMVNSAHVFSDERPRAPPRNAARFLRYVEGTRKQLIGSARLGELREPLLKWDEQRRRTEIIFASTGLGLALRTAKQQIQRYETGLLALLDPQDLSVETPAYKEFVSLTNRLKEHTQTLSALVRDARPRLLTLGFWSERPDGTGTPRRATAFLSAQAEVLRCEVELQHRLKLLSTAHRDLVIEVLDHPLPRQRADSQTQVLSIAVGNEPDAFYPLHNAWVVTTAAAVRVPVRQLPVVLYMFGEDGGLQAFAGLDALTLGVKASLGSLDDSVLWGCVERDKRNDLRAHAVRKTLAVRYLPIDGKPALVALKKLLGCHDRLNKSTEDITRIFSEVTSAELSRTLLAYELERHLNVPPNSALNQAQANIELVRKVMSEAKKMPVWLASATRARRKHFKRSQRVYLSGLFAYRTRLEERLPNLYTFARAALTARLRQEGISEELDIDQPLVDMPDNVYASFCDRFDSRCVVGDRKIILTPSETRMTFSLLQLALHNLDPLATWTKWRFEYASFLQPAWKQRLSAEFLIRIVSSLDIGGQHDALIRKEFYPPVAHDQSLSKGRIPELLKRALRAGVQHHLFSAIQCGLTADAQSLFSTAMAARIPQDLMKNQHELQVHAVHLVGHTMQHDRYIAGLVVVQDKRTGLCVVYWPQAAPALVLTEYSSLQQAQDALNRIGALPENIRILARQVAPGWAFEAINHHPDKLDETLRFYEMTPAFMLVRGIWQVREFIRSFNITHLEPTVILDEIEKIIHEQIASDKGRWLVLVPTSHSDAQALLYHANVFELQRQTQAASQSGKALKAYRTRRLAERHEGTPRRLVGFIFPLFGMLNDFYELLVAARRYHRFGDPHDAVDVGFMSAYMAIDLLLSFLPGPKKVGRAVVGTGRAVHKLALKGLHRLRMTTRGASRSASSAGTQLDVLTRFKVDGVPQGAVELRAPSEKGVYVKNGEAFVTDDAGHYPLYKRAGETTYRVKNSQTPGQDELILNIHQPREWLLGADAPQPVAGTSSGTLRPWRAPTPEPPGWQPPAVRTATENRITQTFSTSTQWLEWPIQRQMDPGMSSVAPDIFYVPADAGGVPHNALMIPTTDTPAYYRLLPAGDQAPLTGIVFIQPDKVSGSAAWVDIRRWTSTAMHEQPFPVSYNSAGGWTLHARLFDRPLVDYTTTAFPNLTSHSREFVVARVVELSGPDRPATATHLLNIRATLDEWLPALPARPGQTDDLLKMLRPTESPGNSVFIGYDGKAPGFTRVDYVPATLEVQLQHGGKAVMAQREGAQRAAVRTVLERQGFTVVERSGTRYFRPAHELIATHPNSPGQLYYVTCEWVSRASFRKGAKARQSWIRAFRAPIDSELTDDINRALRSNRLVRIIAGIQWPTAGRVPPSVYFIKLSLEP
ncbi:dermonecrotic toxin domain-containing protein [Pseudomonas sp. MUP55]|uniref:dermonecrotic toxin domain-containing protein n=1 Tax=Pseudomonas sp. MUP55 TaxID=3087234 RepID=UPI002A5AA8DA|nr:MULTISPECIES: DUF6543 domain-containing protein [unclassified Pseudomonas]WPN91166.1 hypothetical protein SC319_18170 [Pseudomonas sp. MUP56]WPN96692.1 hypothetical protein SC318_18175 [Pseudomonas sp. MUP55]